VHPDSAGEPDGIDIVLRHKDGWSEMQRAQARAKVQMLNDVDMVVSVPRRSLISAARRFLRAGKIIGQGHDVDHIHELQLGGPDTLENMWSLDRSVNRSFGAQIRQQIKHHPVGTRIRSIRIEDP
jgi:hypothetical protein